MQERQGVVAVRGRGHVECGHEAAPGVGGAAQGRSLPVGLGSPNLGAEPDGSMMYV
jgi:hypothetical protein